MRPINPLSPDILADLTAALEADPLSDKEIRQQFKAMRLVASTEYPWLRPILWTLEVVLTEEVGTMGVDRSARLYISPRWWSGPCPVCSQIHGKVYFHTGIEKVAVIVHEAFHVCLLHGKRCGLRDPRTWNKAADLVINSMPGLTSQLPKCGLFPSHYGFPGGKSTEFYYKNLEEQEQNPPPPPKGCPVCGGTEFTYLPRREMIQCDCCGFEFPAQKEKADDEDSEINVKNTPPNEGDEGESNEESDGESGGKSDDKSDDAADSGKSGDDTSEDSDEDSGGSTNDESGGQPGDGEKGGEDSGEESKQKGDQAGRGNCGSGADGQKRDWELPPPIDEPDFENLRRQVAQGILGSDSRGILGDSMYRELVGVLEPPKISWRRLLRAFVLQAEKFVRADQQKNFKKFSKLQDFADLEGVVYPAKVSPIPRISAVVDTSGSVGDEDLKLVMAELQEIVKRSQSPLSVIACDSRVRTVQEIQSIRQLRELGGGGGTDMRIGIEAALKATPTPNIIVILTDGYTPWPEKAPKGCRLIACIVGRYHHDSSPGWMPSVIVEED